jgi:1,4-alpha-glucan branching enzyme
MKLKREAKPEKTAEPVGMSPPDSPNRGKRRILFQCLAKPGSEVFVAGDFNEWNQGKHRLTDKGHPGHFRRHIFLKPGNLEYKFVIDGEWQIDPECTKWSPNQFGSLNSVVKVG